MELLTPIQSANTIRRDAYKKIPDKEVADLVSDTDSNTNNNASSDNDSELSEKKKDKKKVVN